MTFEQVIASIEEVARSIDDEKCERLDEQWLQEVRKTLYGCDNQQALLVAFELACMMNHFIQRQGIALPQEIATSWNVLGEALAMAVPTDQEDERIDLPTEH
jgi:hypothetical protein